MGTSMRGRLVIGAAAWLLIGFLATAGMAADMRMAGTTLKAAIAEAGKAASATTLKSAHAHLQSLVNCLEGPGGSMFKKMEGAMMMSACEGKGKGLLVDAKAAGGMMGVLPWFEAANENAALGLKAMTLARAQAAGYAAQSLLQRAEKSMMMKKM